MKGKLDGYNEKGAYITTDEGKKFYKFADYIKTSYLKNAKNVEFSLQDGVISFIKKDENEHIDSSKKNENNDKYNEIQDKITKQFCINASLELFKLNRDNFEGIITVEQIEPVAKLIYKLVKKKWE